MVLPHVVGLLLLGLFIPVVFSNRCVLLSDSRFGAFSGTSTMLDSYDTSLECTFERKCSQKLRILSILEDFNLWDFFGATPISSLLISFQFCCSLFLFICGCFIHSDLSLNLFSSLHTCFQNFLTSSIVVISFTIIVSPTLFLCKTSLHLFRKSCFCDKILVIYF